MRNYPFKTADLVIPNSTAISNSFDLRKTRFRGLTIFAPSALTNACKVQVSTDDSSWQDLQSGGSDVAVALDKAIVIDYVGFEYLRIESAGNEAAERTFKVRAVEDF